MSRRGRLALVVAALAVAGSASLWGPPLLRRVDWFDVRRVEVSGSRLLAPHQVLALSGIRRGSSLWEDLEARERALAGHPAIAAARISRRPPHTLRVRVEEERPVALVEADALAPITASGDLFPVDPAEAPVDLPVIRGAWADMDVPLRRRVLAETDRLTRLDPALLAEVSEIRMADAGIPALILAHRRALIVLPVGAAPRRLAQLRAVLRDLEQDAAPATPALPRVDLRYEEQVVVRLPSSV